MTGIDRGPLTTTFTAPKSCSTDFSNLYYVVDDTGGYYAQGPVNVGDCYPSGFSMSSSEYYSPGVCPSGYNPACISSTSIGTLTETTYTCCPTAHPYTCGASNHPGWGGCYYDIPSETSVFNSVYYVSGSNTSLIQTITNVFGAINAQSIQVRFQSSDFASTTTTTTTSSSSSPSSITAGSEASQTASVATSNSIAANTSPAADGDSEGLGTGAKAGIGVGIGVAVLALVGAMFFFFSKRRRVPDSEEETSPYFQQYNQPNDAQYDQQYNQQYTQQYNPQYNQQYDQQHSYHTPAPAQCIPQDPSELPGFKTCYEMSGDIAKQDYYIAVEMDGRDTVHQR